MGITPPPGLTQVSFCLCPTCSLKKSLGPECRWRKGHVFFPLSLDACDSKKLCSYKTTYFLCTLLLSNSVAVPILLFILCQINGLPMVSYFPRGCSFPGPADREHCALSKSCSVKMFFFPALVCPPHPAVCLATDASWYRF